MWSGARLLLHQSVSSGRNSYILKNLATSYLVSCNYYCSVSSRKVVTDIKDENVRLLFLGNDNFSLTCLRAVEEILPAKKCLSVVVSNRNNIVGKYANKNSIRNFLWDDIKSKDHLEEFDIGVVASFGHLIPKRVIEKCGLGILNAHGSLLPKYRGAAPISRAICNGDTETGVSIMKIAPHRFDIGPVILRKKCKIHPHIRSPELTTIMAKVGGSALKEVLLNLESSMEAQDLQQNEEATYAPKLTPDVAQVNWEIMTAVEVYNLFRGLAGFSKLFSYYCGKRIDLDEFGLVFPGEVDHIDEEECNSGEPISEATDFSRFYSYPVIASVSVGHKRLFDCSVPGQVTVYKNLVIVCCADKNFVTIRKVKVGSKWMTAKDFKNGYISKSQGPQLFMFNPESSYTASAMNLN